jgi:hypothetical protein
MKKKKKKKASNKKVINYLLDESIEIDHEELEFEKEVLATPVEPYTECHCELSVFLFKKVNLPFPFTNYRPTNSD